MMIQEFILIVSLLGEPTPRPATADVSAMAGGRIPATEQLGVTVTSRGRDMSLPGASYVSLIFLIVEKCQNLRKQR